MSSVLVFAAYGCAVALPVALLRFFGPRAWYWHALSIGLALALGLTPTPTEWNSPGFDLAMGSVFTFLFIWGVAPPFVQTHPLHFHWHFPLHWRSR